MAARGLDYNYEQRSYRSDEDDYFSGDDDQMNFSPSERSNRYGAGGPGDPYDRRDNGGMQMQTNFGRVTRFQN